MHRQLHVLAADGIIKDAATWGRCQQQRPCV